MLRIRIIDRALTVFALAGTAAALLVWINRYGLEFPFFDEWLFLERFLRAMEQHNYGFLLAEFNSHRIVTASVCYFLLYLAGTWYSFYFYYLSAACAFGAAGLLIWLACSTWRRLNPVHPWLITVPIAAVICCAQQSKNWTFAFNTFWYHYLFFSCLCLVSLAQFRGRLAFGLSLISGCLASLTITAGILVWPIGALILAVQIKFNAARLRRLVLWCVTASVPTYAAFLHNVSRASGASADLPNAPLLAVETFLALVGATIFNQNGRGAVAVGTLALLLYCLALVCFCVLVRRRLRRRSGAALQEQDQLLLDLSVWLGLGLFSILALAMIAVTRFSFVYAGAWVGGPAYALRANRYITVAVLFWTSLYVISLAAAFWPGWSRAARRIYTSLLCLLIVVAAVLFCRSSGHALDLWQEGYSKLARARYRIFQYDPRLLLAFEEPRWAGRSIGLFTSAPLSLLYKHNLSPYHFERNLRSYDTRPPKPEMGEAVSAAEIQSAGLSVCPFRGWAADPNTPSQRAAAVLAARGSKVIARILLDPEASTKDWSYFHHRRQTSEGCQLSFYAAAADGRTLAALPLRHAPE